MNARSIGRPASTRRGSVRGECRARRAVLALLSRRRRSRSDDDLPGRVGRVAEFAGQLLLSPQDRPTTGRRSASTIRSPRATTCGCRRDGRAEVDYGGGQFRLAGDTNVHVARLDDRQLALFVAQGRVIVRVRVLDPGDVARIDTPNTQIALTRPGLYRIDVAPDRQHDDARRARGRRPTSSSPARRRSRCCRARRRRVDRRRSASRGRAQRRRRRRLRHVERRAAIARYERAARDGVRVAADGRRRGSRPRTAPGRPTPNTAPSGFPTPSRPTGRRIATATGRTSAAGAPRGSTARRGATRRSTTAAGRTSAAAGAGVPGGYVARPVWAPALVALVRRPGLGRVAASAAPSTAGCRSAGASRITRVAPLLGRLLGALQPAVCGQRRRAARARRRRATSNCARARRRYRRCPAPRSCRPQARRSESVAVRSDARRRRSRRRRPRYEADTPVRPARSDARVRCRHRRRRSTSLARPRCARLQPAAVARSRRVASPTRRRRG